MQLDGSVNHIIFRNEQNGYTVADFEVGDGQGGEILVTIVGEFFDIKEGTYLHLSGEWTDHMIYGEQFKVESYRSELPENPQAIKSYLASGALPGIGPKMADTLVERFGAEIFEIIENEPGRLLEVPGLGKKTLDKILQGYHDGQSERNILVLLQDYEIPVKTARKIVEVFGDKTVSVLKEDPYQIALKVPGIGFKKADEIASKMGIGHDNTRRVTAGILYALQDCYKSGHTYLPADELTQVAAGLLGVESEQVEEELDSVLFTGRAHKESVDDTDYYYPVELYKAEDNAAFRLGEILKAEVFSKDTEKIIKKLEKTLAIRFDKSQRRALNTAVGSPVSVITGGPGTGKTTVISGLCEIFDSLGIKTALAAPTGRAAQRMSQTSGRPASTIHRLLEYEYNADERLMSFRKNEDNPIEAGAVIIDESSMLDIELFSSLLSAVERGTRLIFVGDVDQLPSVGPGNVLGDLIDSGRIPTVYLTDIHRREEGSAISVGAHEINRGVVPEVDNASDFMVINKNFDTVALDTIIDLAGARIPEVFGFDPFSEIQVISPLKRGLLGTISLNAELQKRLNPPEPGKPERRVGEVIYRLGDKVMQIKNDYKIAWENPQTGASGEGIFNGEIGIITAMDEDGFEITFSDGRVSRYGFGQTDEISHAYAMTVHKSQGSEFKAVVMPLMGGYPDFMNKRLLYTAVTRAKDKMILIGQKGYFDYMIHNTKIDRRRTRLAEKIKKYENFF